MAEMKTLAERKPTLTKIPEVGNPEASQAENPIPVVQATAQLKPEGAVSTANTEKRGPGRPPGSTNKPKTETPAPPKNSAKTAPRGKTGPPDFSEWQEFIGGIVIHWVVFAFTSVMLRGINRDFLTDEEKEDIELDDEEEMLIAKPISNWLLSSNFNGKYGRQIINARDSIESIVVLCFHMSRVSRVAKKYRPKHAKKGTVDNVRDIRPVDNRPEESQQAFPPAGYRFNAQFGPTGTGFN